MSTSNTQTFIRISIQGFFTAILTSIFVWCYVGMSWSPDTSVLKVTVFYETSLIQAAIDATVKPAIDAGLSSRFTIEYRIDSKEYAQQQVESNNIWSAFFVSTEYAKNVSSGNISFVDYIHATAKNPSTDRGVLNGIRLWEAAWRKQIALGMISKNTTAPVNTLIQGPVGVNYVDLNPVDHEGQNFISFIGPIILWFANMTVCRITYDGHVIIEGLLRAVFLTMILVVNSTMVALVPMVLSGAQFVGGTSGQSLGWLLFAALTFASIQSLLYCLFGKTLMQAISVTLLYWQISSCSGIMYYETVPQFFWAGRGFPMFYAVRALRFVYFGVYGDTIVQDGLSLGAWLVIPLIAAAGLFYTGMNRKLGYRVYQFTRTKFDIEKPERCRNRDRS